MGDTSQKKVSIVLSHTAAWSKELPVCAPPQGHKEFVCLWHSSSYSTFQLRTASPLTEACFILQHSQFPIYF